MTVTRSSFAAAGAFSPARLGPVTLRNRVIKSATFEGMSRGGLVSDALVEFHRRMAAGGVGMTTLAYAAVASDGRTYRHQIWLREEAVPGLRRLTGAVHAEGALAAIQLGHPLCVRARGGVDDRSRLGGREVSGTARVIAVTGAASGIGAAVSSELAAGGCRVIGVDLQDAEIIADLATPAGRAAAASGITGACGGRLDGLVCCAGVGRTIRPGRSPPSITPAQWSCWTRCCPR